MTAPLWTCSDLAEATGGTVTHAFAATGVSIDTRTLQPGDLFIALQGEGRDGHAFVDDAFRNGAAGAMVQRDATGASAQHEASSQITHHEARGQITRDDARGQITQQDAHSHTTQQDAPGHITQQDARGQITPHDARGAVAQSDARGATERAAAPLLRVDDTLAALARLGAFGRARSQAQVVAITGSVGKTTTKEMLRCILAENGPTHAAVASYNNHWGLPLTLARLPPAAAFCVVEIGMNHAGEIAPLAGLARPHVAVITSIEKAHIGHLGSLEAIADEKAAIMQGLLGGGSAVLPMDSPMFPRLRAAAGTATVFTFGAADQADARLMQTEADSDGSLVHARIAGVDLRFRLRAPGRHMALNAIAALLTATVMGLDPASAAHALERFVPIVGRGLRRTVTVAGGAILLLDESYNGNGASVRAALEVLRLQPGRRRIAVLGDMLELGEAGPAEHAGLAPDVVRSADLVFTCGPLMRRLSDALPERVRAAGMPDAAALAPIVAAALRPGDVVLVKGSLGSRMRIVVQAIEAMSLEQAGAA